MDMSAKLKTIKEQYKDTIGMSEKVIKLGAKWCDIDIEIDGQQALHIIGIDDYAYINGHSISFASQKTMGGKRPTWQGIKSRGNGDKLWRLKIVSEKYEDREVHFNTQMKYTATGLDILDMELRMTTHTEIKAKTDDCLDGLSQLALMDVYAPPKPLVKVGYNRQHTTPRNPMFEASSNDFITDETEYNRYYI
jgi:hypothetical protein